MKLHEAFAWLGVASTFVAMVFMLLAVFEMNVEPAKVLKPSDLFGNLACVAGGIMLVLYIVAVMYWQRGK